MKKAENETFNALISRLNRYSFFQEEDHIVAYKGANGLKECMSVTTLIQRYLSGEKFEQLSKFIDMDKFAAMGTEIHKAIELALLGSFYDRRWEKNVKEAKQAIKLYNVKYMALEVPVCSELLVGGIVDLLGIDNKGEYIIMDGKTSTRPLIEHTWQLDIYAYLLKRYYGVQVKRKVCVYTGRKENSPFKIKENTDPVCNIVKAILLIHKEKMKLYGEDYGYLQ